jgi:hypothetical protein
MSMQMSVERFRLLYNILPAELVHLCIEYDDKGTWCLQHLKIFHGKVCLQCQIDFAVKNNIGTDVKRQVTYNTGRSIRRTQTVTHIDRENIIATYQTVGDIKLDWYLNSTFMPRKNSQMNSKDENILLEWNSCASSFKILIYSEGSEQLGRINSFKLVAGSLIQFKQSSRNIWPVQVLWKDLVVD